MRLTPRPTTIFQADPFTRYGAIAGDLVTVSNDAATDEKLGLVYPMRVRLAATRMRIDEKEVDLSAGMAVTVEIKTGQRRLIEYFLRR
jgi:hemolysin D